MRTGRARGNPNRYTCGADSFAASTCAFTSAVTAARRHTDSRRNGSRRDSYASGDRDSERTGGYKLRPIR